LAIAAYYEMNQGRPERARALAHASLRDGVVATSPYPFFPYQALGFIEVATGDYQRAVEFENEARAAFDAVDNPLAEAQLLSALASYEALVGQVDQARADAERALELARRLRNPTTLAMAFHGTAWALQRDDPGAALAAAEQYLDLQRETHASDEGVAGALLALAGGLRARLGDPVGALELVREAVIVSRDQGKRPQLAAALDWSLAPLIKLGRPEPAATFVGALTGGPLAEVSGFPDVDAARARTLDRLRASLGDETTDARVAHGAAMTYDEIIEYALHHLDAA
jgi:tetratricopeptide (TPR) repeat protein